MCYSCNLVFKIYIYIYLIPQCCYYVLILIVIEYLRIKINYFSISSLVTDFITSYCKQQIFYNQKSVICSNNLLSGGTTTED